VHDIRRKYGYLNPMAIWRIAELNMIHATEKAYIIGGKKRWAKAVGVLC